MLRAGMAVCLTAHCVGSGCLELPRTEASPFDLKGVNGVFDAQYLVHRLSRRLETDAL